MHKQILLMALTFPLCWPISAGAQPFVERPMCMATHYIRLSGVASGGTLTFFQTPSRNATRCVSIETSPGETAEAVAQRLAAAINAHPDEFKWAKGNIATRGSAIGPLPSSPDGTYILAGTEKGLGIPAPPTSLSANYRPHDDSVILRWVNPPGGYDRVAVLTNGWGRGRPGDTTTYTWKGPSFTGRIDDLCVCVVGYRNGVPSGAAAINVKRNIQEEAVGLPFVGGTAPNWTAWSTDPDPAAPLLTERKRGKNVKGKTFFQMIRSSKPGPKVGIWRKFIGLTPGHTYRVSTWVCTGDMDAVQTDWSFSLHAVADPPGGADLTAAQMAGLASLPGGSIGPEAGRIAEYRRGVATARNRFERVSTDDNEVSRGRAIADITLPENTDSITVWARYHCAEPNASGVALDHLRLEDLTSEGK